MNIKDNLVLDFRIYLGLSIVTGVISVVMSLAEVHFDPPQH